MRYTTALRVGFFSPILAFNLEGLATPRMLVCVILHLPYFRWWQRLPVTTPTHFTLRFMVVFLAVLAKNISPVQGKGTSLA
jgi:hypothetical protein